MSTLRKSLVTALAAATLLGLSPVVGYNDAAAQPQFRRPPPGGGMRPGPGPGPMRAAPGRNRNGGGAAAGAAFGLIAGALISSAMEQQRQQQYERQYQRQQVYDDEVEYCMERFRSYNPRTGTYRGNDGRLYRCP
jgi:hypothetical protein